MFDFNEVNATAFITTTALAGVTGGGVYGTVAAIRTAQTVAAIGYGILATTGAGASMGSITAWLDPTSTTVGNYFANVRSQGAIAIAGMYQFVTQTMFHAVVDGLREGITGLVSAAISGSRK